MSFQVALNKHFPDTLSEARFVDRTSAILEPRGFTAENTIACVAVCRDELCTPLQRQVRATWGEAFNMSGLAGVPLCGRTAFGAAHGHAPNLEGTQRYVYICMAHIGIGDGGELGQCQRVGRAGTSKACGAVAALHLELLNGNPKLGHDADDLEQSQLRSRLLRRVGWAAVPTLIELTQYARIEALETLERMISITLDTDTSDYAVFNGVQIHGPGDNARVWLAASYVVVGGVREDLDATGLQRAGEAHAVSRN